MKRGKATGRKTRFVFAAAFTAWAAFVCYHYFAQFAPYVAKLIGRF